ncbi:MAG: 3-isopropylmalate dehydratase small subunit [Thaumarchaeota archaeon]|nr:3-isopropylmalate dehydratase small subunit [Nitrososphaerota archaeon]GFN40297.1 MAG: 3-isopropylmalate dehydratase small subunit [Marine Group I thaumarchaeote]
MKSSVIKYDKDNIDTDVILPGQYLKLHDYAEIAKHAMEGIDKNFHSKVKNAEFIVAGKNFGCGSSREHATIALSQSGIKAVLAVSFARIFYRNAVDGAFLLPIEIDENAYKNISDKDELEINTEKNKINNLTKEQVYSMKQFPELIKKIIDAGGLFNYKP